MLKRTLTFLVHQLISTFGVMLGCNIATSQTASLLNWLFGPSKSLRSASLLTGIPGFPLQVACALLLGYSLGIKTAFKGMLWVWIFPCLVLTCRCVGDRRLSPRAVQLLLRDWLPCGEPLFHPNGRNTSGVELGGVHHGRSAGEIPLNEG